MTRQEEIRRKLEEFRCSTCSLGGRVDCRIDCAMDDELGKLLKDMEDLGVVIKAERELPKADQKGFMADVINETIRKLSEAGYKAVVSLIEVKNG